MPPRVPPVQNTEYGYGIRNTPSEPSPRPIPIRNTEYAIHNTPTESSLRLIPIRNTDTQYAIRHQSRVQRPSLAHRIHNTQYGIQNLTQTACFELFTPGFGGRPVHNTQYGIRNAQSLSRQRYVNTEQGQSVRSQSIRNVNRISHVSCVAMCPCNTSESISETKPYSFPRHIGIA